MTGKDLPPRDGTDDSREEPEQPSAAEHASETPLPATERAGDDDLQQETIGPYRLLETLGEGGMGVVYLAEQHEPIHRRVALKVIKLGMDTREVIARFESERQALAMMNHPNIAGVLDAGTTEAGRPYFVMEHVPGVPITDYCDLHKLTTRQRLELYRPVCLALQHAHQKGIIHRDLKPSNVLVRVQDGKPVPKVIDFGVAKAIDQTLTEKTLFTQQGRLVGTPAYMSPEQAEMTGLNVDTTSDVYSLGVLLYELLTGALPFEQDELRRAGLLEMHRIIREVDPPRPSTRISSFGATGADLALRRQVEVRAWRRQLRGELDWITMRAMEKDRTRRYASASEFAADIAHYLRDEPVAAGPPSTTYRLGKFVRRHRSLVVAISALIVVLIGGIIGISAALSRASREAERARTELARSDQVVAFTSEMLAGVDPQVARGMDQELLRLIMDKAAGRIETELAGQPEVAVTLRHIIGETYRNITEYEDAETHFTQSLELCRRTRGADHPETLKSEVLLGSLYTDMGRYKEAEPLLDHALAEQREQLGEDYPTTLTTMNNLALLYHAAGRMEDAGSLGRQVLASRRRVLGEDHPNTMSTLNNLALVLAEQGHNEDAAKMLQETVDSRKVVLGEDHPNTLLAMGNLAAIWVQLGRNEDAEVVYLELIATQKRVMGDEHDTTMSSQNNLGLIYRNLKRYAEAESLYVEVLTVRRRTLGEEHPETLNCITNLARIYDVQDRFDEAEPLYVENVTVLERVLGEDHPKTLICLNNFSAMYRRQERYQEAASLAERAVAGSRRTFPEGHWIVGVFLVNHGAALVDLDRCVAAEAELLEAHGILVAAQGPTHERTASAIKALVKLYEHWPRSAEAETWRAALALAESDSAEDEAAE